MVSVNTTSAHQRPVFVDCHSCRLVIDHQCIHSLHRNDMAYCHFELCRDCGLGCLSESLYGGCRWWQWCSCIKKLFFLQENITASLLELHFNDSMQTVRARRRWCRWQSRKRGRRLGGWANGDDVVFTDTGFRRK